MNNMDQFQGQGNNQFQRFTAQNPSLNVIQIQPVGNFSIRNNTNSNNMYCNNESNLTTLGMNINNQSINNNTNNKPAKRKAETYACAVCSIEVTSQDILQSHMNGQKHAKKLRQIQDNQLNTQVKSINSNQESADKSVENKTLIQQNPIESKSILQKINELVSYHKHKLVYDIVSENGPQHAKIFEIRCSLIDLKTNNVVESVITTGSSHSKAKQNAAEILIKQTKLELPSKDQKKNAKNSQQRQHDDIKEQKRDKRKLSKQHRNSQALKDQTPKSAVEIENSEYELNNKIFIKNHLLSKHKQIQPSREQLDLIGNLIENIEKSLKKISDKLVNEELLRVPEIEIPVSELSEDSATKAKPDDSKETHRHLKGVVRVGTIVKTLFLKTDRNIHLVVLLSKAPTYAFVSRISEELNTELNLISEKNQSKNHSESKDVEMVSVDNQKNTDEKPVEYKPPRIIYHMDKSEELIKNEACVNVKCELPDSDFLAEENDYYFIKISFTSMGFLSKTGNSINLTKPEKMESTDISEEKCISALTEIRRVKWFNARLKPIANAILILRIMRDLCQRKPTWSVLSDWLLELIVEKCFLKNRYEDIALKLRAVFECISSGLLFMPNFSLKFKKNDQQMNNKKSTETDSKNIENKTDKDSSNNDEITLGFCDPCAEAKSETNVFESHLTLQQREELTFSAQDYLRLIAFRKAHEFLATDLIKMPVNSYKYRYNNDNRFKRFKKDRAKSHSVNSHSEKIEENIEDIAE